MPRSRSATKPKAKRASKAAAKTRKPAAAAARAKTAKTAKVAKKARPASTARRPSKAARPAAKGRKTAAPARARKVSKAAPKTKKGIAVSKTAAKAPAKAAPKAAPKMPAKAAKPAAKPAAKTAAKPATPAKKPIPPKAGKVAALIWYEPEQYPRVVKIMSDKGDFPPTYEAWAKPARAEEETRRAEGWEIIRVSLDPNMFASWCASRGLKRNAEARRAYVRHAALARLHDQRERG